MAGCPQAHSGQSHDEGIFAAHPVTQISEQKRRPQWTNQEAGGKQGRWCSARRQPGGFVEELADRTAANTEDVEVVPFDDVAYGAATTTRRKFCGNLPGIVFPFDSFGL